MWKWLRWLLLVPIVLIIAFLVYNARLSKQFETDKDAKFITAIPFDLTQIKRISSFRSCMGHDYSSLNMEGIRENDRSMKHYVEPLDEFHDTNDKVKLFAPFDGTVVQIESKRGELVETDARFGGKGFALAPDTNKSWTFEFGHVFPSENLTMGTKVKKGELIGYAYVQPKGSSFDLALWTDREGFRQFRNDGEQMLDSIMNHMTDSVLSEFSKFSITKENLIIPKEVRDAKSCQNAPAKVNVAGEQEVLFVPSNGGNGDTVQVVQPK